MTTTQLISNLVTISKSWINKFMKAIEERTDLSLIDQFYVGFSSFLVSDIVVVVTSKHDDDD
jgi:HSP90 family molecular chaperone